MSSTARAGARPARVASCARRSSRADGFRSAQDIYADLRSAGEAVGLSTVYRHLQSLADAGGVDVIHHARR